MAKSPTDHLAAFSIRSFRDTASVDDAIVSIVVNADYFIPLRPKLSRNRGRFSEIQLAAKSMESNSSHRYEKELPVSCGQLFPFFIAMLFVQWFVSDMFRHQTRRRHHVLQGHR